MHALLCMWGCCQKSFHQIMLCLNMPRINHPGSDSQSLKQRQLFSCVELNSFLAPRVVSAGHRGRWGPSVYPSNNGIGSSWEDSISTWPSAGTHKVKLASAHRPAFFSQWEPGLLSFAVLFSHGSCLVLVTRLFLVQFLKAGVTGLQSQYLGGRGRKTISYRPVWALFKIEGGKRG